MMARERERVFALQKFSYQEEAELGTNADQQQDNQHTNIYSQFYGANYGAVAAAAATKNTMLDDSSDAEYVEPARTSYPEDQGILNSFAAKNKPKADQDDMEFS